MIRFEITVNVGDDRRVEFVLPPEVPVGKHEIVVSLATQPDNLPRDPPPRQFRLSDWAKKNAEDLGPDIRSDDVEGFTGRRF